MDVVRFSTNVDKSIGTVGIGRIVGTELGVVVNEGEEEGIEATRIG